MVADEHVSVNVGECDRISECNRLSVGAIDALSAAWINACLREFDCTVRCLHRLLHIPDVDHWQHDAHASLAPVL